jgi:hypothetical protein
MTARKEPHADIQIDPEFADLIPPLAVDELAQLTSSIQNEGCRNPLIVWKEKRLLLDGHNRFRICGEHSIAFKTVELEFSDREAAREFILRNQLTRRNLSPEAVSYLRGKRYLAMRHQGEKIPTSGQNVPKRYSEVIAEEYNINEKTVRRDAEFAEAIDEIAGNCGDDCRKSILARDAGLTRFAVLELRDLSPKEQRKYIQELIKTGKRPRRQRTETNTIRVPTEPEAMTAERHSSSTWALRKQPI